MPLVFSIAGGHRDDRSARPPSSPAPAPASARAVATALLKAGWNTVFCGRRKPVLDDAIAEAGPTEAKALAVACDITKADEVDDLFETVAEAFGRVDLLFNNAGMGYKSTLIDEIPVEVWNDIVGVNLTGSFLCARAAFGAMRRQKPDGRPHHQQRLGLGPCAAPGLGALHRDQARHHRADQDAGARRPALRHRLRPDRHRQCADRHGRSR